jgi:hypothetical protein
VQPAGRLQHAAQGPHVRRLGRQANYFDVTVWGAQGENCATYLQKGRPLAIDAASECRKGEVPDGSGKLQAVSIVAEFVQCPGRAGRTCCMGQHQPGRGNVWQEFLANRAERGFAREIVTPDAAQLAVRIMHHGLGSLRGAIGTPDQVVDLCLRYESAGVDQVIFVLQAGPNRHPSSTSARASSWSASG